MYLNEYLIDFVIIDGAVKHGVKVIKEVNDLHRRTHCRDGRETDDITEVDGGLLVALRQHRLAQ